jgi:hypothetical protein
LVANCSTRLDAVGVVVGADETGIERGEIGVGGDRNWRNDGTTGRGDGVCRGAFDLAKFGRLSLGTTIVLKHAKSIKHFINIIDIIKCKNIIFIGNRK